MSINVTVTGNPVSINRGKMVAADLNYTQKDFEKRRLLRLEQVRQQSKDIAEDVRNKVRREKKKQIKQIEEEGKEKLRNWQNRKLLEIQTQYKEAMKELGTAHKQADDLADESDVLLEQKQQSKQVSKQRGEIAAVKLQTQKKEDMFKKTFPVQQRKLVREIENARAAMVTNLSKNKSKNYEPKYKKSKVSHDVNITLQDLPSGNETSPVPSLQNELSQERDDGSNSSSSCKCLGNSDIPGDSSGSDSTIDKPELFKSDERMARNQDLPDQEISTVNPPVDTRISDQIKRRNIVQPQIYQPTTSKLEFNAPVQTSTKLSEAISRREIPSNLGNTTDNDCCRNLCSRCRKLNVHTKDSYKHVDSNKENLNVNVESRQSVQRKSASESQKSVSVIQKPVMVSKDVQTTTEIPIKPPVRLTDTSSLENAYNINAKSITGSKMQYYDHHNRLSGKREIPSASYVEKISTDNIEPIPNLPSEVDFSEKIKKREKDAQIRGQKALEKERIKKDYEELLKKLPLLQKQERVYEIHKDKPEYHMSEDRLKEKEKIKQTHMENAYNKLFPNLKPAVVTLPRKTQADKMEPVKNVQYSVEEPVQSINVGEWDVDFKEPKMFTAQEVQEIVSAYANKNPKHRQEKLKKLLKNLKLQKEQLLKELKSLPVDESVNELINDLNSSDGPEPASAKEKSKTKSKRKRGSDSEFDSTTESTSLKARSSSGQKTKKKNRSPRKRVKTKTVTKVLVLQNTSTQTTPNVECNSQGAESKQDPCGKLPNGKCDKLHVPCDCSEKKTAALDELCQIYIKLNDETSPEIVVKTKDKELEEKSIEITKEVTTDKVPSKRTLEHKIKKPINTIRKPVEKSRSITKDTPDTKSKSWNEQFSKNSVSTSSTSYLSPPDFQKLLHLHANSNYSDKSRSFYNLHNKPKQENLHGLSMGSKPSEKSADATLFSYVKLLLNMSRESVENLNVSSVSTVPTPTQSIIEIESNNPSAQLQNIMKYLNFKIQDLSYSRSSSPHYNTSASASETHSVGDAMTPNVNPSGKPKGTTIDKIIAMDSMSNRYADVTDNCSKRIANLAEMIKKLRAEKIEMFQIPPANIAKDEPGEKDISTAYMELPKEGSRHSSSSSSGSSLNEEEIYRRLVEIDMSLAKKLRQLSSDKPDTPDSNDPVTVTAGISDKELWMRLKKLKNTQEKIDQLPPPPETSTTKGILRTQLSTQERPVSTENTNSTFVPFLSDIPKLPKFEAESESKSCGNKRPPPSKGLATVRRFNDDISLVPHELSTIPEADSQLSAKLLSPNNSKSSHMLCNVKDVDLIVIPESETKSIKLPEVAVVAPLKCDDNSCKQPNITSSSSASKEDVASKSSSKSTSLSSSSSTDNIESLEAMLKSIGMEWAIPTLYKTQEALALTSSSSSLDLSSKKKSKTGPDSSNSQASWKALLQQQIFAKISSSTLLSDASPGSLLGEISDLSGIQATSLLANKEHQRTSTPLLSSKNSTKSKESAKAVAFSGDSDISSVKNNT